MQADVRIPDPRISRAHLILRFEQGRWLAIDNGSLNGTYLNGYRMPVVDIHDGQSIHVGNPHGPRLTFALGPQQGHAGHPARPRPSHDSGPPTLTWTAITEQTNPTRLPRRPVPPAGRPDRRAHRRRNAPSSSPARRPDRASAPRALRPSHHGHRPRRQRNSP